MEDNMNREPSLRFGVFNQDNEIHSQKERADYVKKMKAKLLELLKQSDENQEEDTE